MKKYIFLLILSISFISAKERKSIYEYKVQTIDGQEYDMSKLKGKKVLIVNVASKCGLTEQYIELEELYKKYKSIGFEIIAFPCNDFLSQEPGTNAEIKEFCSQEYSISFPLMAKISVKGKDQAPIYQWLTQKDYNNYSDNKVKWNFQKYLIDRDGKLINVLSPGTAPNDPEIISFIRN